MSENSKTLGRRNSGNQFLRSTILFGIIYFSVALVGFGQSTQLKKIKCSTGFALSPPSPRLPGGYLAVGLEIPVRGKFAFSGEVSAAYMQRTGYNVEDFTEHAFVVDIDLGIDFRKSRGLNTFGMLVGPVLRYYDGRSIGDRNTFGNKVIWYEVRDENYLYLGYHIGGFWDYQFREKLSLGIRYKAFVFFDEFSNHTVGVTLKRRL